MDSTAYLAKQGWRGSGHSLHPSGRGITKPLLVAKKNNTLGVGKKAVDVHADQWWNRAFDSGLKSLKVGKNHQESEVKRESTALDSMVQARKHGLSRWGGLYGSFTKGETLSGTMTRSTASQSAISNQPPDEASSGIELSSESREGRIEARRTAKKQKRRRESGMARKDKVKLKASKR